MFDLILGSNIVDNIIEEMLSSIAHQHERMSKSYHNLFEQECG